MKIGSRVTLSVCGGGGKVPFTDLNFKLAYLRKILIALKALYELILADPMSS